MTDVDVEAVFYPADVGEMAERIAAHPWASTPLGPASAWPQSLKTAIDIMLASAGPVSILWGPERIQLYNDAYIPIAGERHPAALGRTTAENWKEAYDHFLGPVCDRVFAAEAVSVQQHPVLLHTPAGAVEERFFTGSFLPIRLEKGDVGGVFHPLNEVTEKVRADARARERDERLHRVLEGMGEAFGLLAPDFTILEHNLEALRLAGRPREDIVGRPHWEVYPGSEDSELGLLLKKAMATREPVSLEHRYDFENGRASWLEMRAYPTAGGALAVFWRDVTDRHEAEQSLHETSRRLDAILNNTREAVFLMDHRQHCVYANAAAEKLTGYTFAEMRGRPLHDVIHHKRPDGSHYPLEECPIDRAFPERAQMSGEELFVHKDGSFYPVWYTASPLLDEAGEPVGTVIEARNIVEEKARDAALHELHEKLEERIEEALAERKVFADVIESSDAAVTALDLDFTVLAINTANVDAFEQVYGKRPKVGDNLLELMQGLPDHQRQLRAFWSRALAGEDYVLIEEFGELERRTYEVRFTVLRDLSGRQIGAASTAYDVTKRVRADAKLAEAEAARREADALYRAYFENTPEALFVIAVEPDGGFVVEQINPAHEAGVGLPLEEVRGKRIEEILPPDTAEQVLKSYRRVVETGALYQYQEVFDLGGNPQHWDTSLVPVRDADGRIVKLIGSSRNVTRQVVAEEALRQTQKMEAMGHLTGGVAHDFNNLLTPIIGSLDMLHRKGSGDAREQRLITGALQSAEKAKTLVQRLLAFARRQPLQPQPVDVTRLITGMAEIVSSTTGPQIKVVVEAADDLPAAEADANQLEMALLNLSVNARDAMPGGGTLRITGSAEEVGEGHRANLRPGRYIRLSVADTGSGMDEATLQRAVEPFFSTKGIGKGTGLGLSMVHGLAAQLGGALSIQSHPGVGTNIELWLPQSTRGAETVDAGAAAAGIPPGLGTALLVEDDELVRTSTAEMLTELGYLVEEAHCAEEALRLVERGLQVDLLVTDHLMPGMNGTELARLLRGRWPDLPVLVVSGFAHVDDLAPDLPRLSKPFRQSELAAMLGELST